MQILKILFVFITVAMKLEQKPYLQNIATGTQAIALWFY